MFLIFFYCINFFFYLFPFLISPQGNITSDNVADVGVILVLASNEPEAISPIGLELILDTLTRIVEVDSESKRVSIYCGLYIEQYI